MARFFRRVLIAVLLIAIAAAGVVGYGYTRFVAPGPLASDTTLIIPRGTRLEGIAGLFQSKGIIDNTTIFELGVRVLGEGKPLHAGEYAFPKAVSPRAAIEILQSGKTVVRHFTVPEGLTSHEIIARLNTADGLSGTAVAVPAEGSLLPETYNFSYGDARPDMIRRMEGAMKETVAKLWDKRASDLPFTSMNDAVILASIVERETGRPDERARVAGVFVNRLRAGMKLQSDPTVAYAVTNGQSVLDRPLSHDDLESPSPYNTYAHTGLPPTPIANPGRASIEAVLNPTESGDFYFVADGSGGHVFARTLSEHNQNVTKWRAFLKSHPGAN